MLSARAMLRARVGMGCKAPAREYHGRYAGTLDVIGDLVSRYRRRAAAIGTSQVQYALLASDSADTGLWLWEPERGCVWMNPYCRNLVGAADSSLPLEVFLGSLA